MKLSKILLLFTLPAIIWSSPLKATQPQTPPPPCSLLSYENLSYDNIIAFIESVEYGNLPEFLTESQIHEILLFITHLARKGVPEWNTQAKEELERDIEWLFSDDEADFYWEYSNLNHKQYSAIPAIFFKNDPYPKIIPCKGWISKSWSKTKKFVKKHKKTIIIATVVVAVATVVIIATSGAAAAPIAAAGAAGTAASANPHVNKAGDVRFQDQNPPEEPPPIAIENPYPPINTTSMVHEQTEIVKETLSEQIPSEALNIPPKEEPSFWGKTHEAIRETSSILVHETLKDAANLIGITQEQDSQDYYHEKIDEFFGTEFASLYTPEIQEKQPEITQGMLPPPGGNLIATAKKIATAAQATGATIIGSALTKPPTFSNPTSAISKQIDPRLPSNPEELLKDTSWVETSHPNAKEFGHRTFENTETQEKLRYDEGKPGKEGHKGKSHWHRMNPDKTSKQNEYLDANNNPVPKNSPESHLYPPE